MRLTCFADPKLVYEVRHVVDLIGCVRVFEFLLLRRVAEEVRIDVIPGPRQIRRAASTSEPCCARPRRNPSRAQQTQLHSSVELTRKRRCLRPFCPAREFP